MTLDPETAAVVDRYASRALAIRHVWQEDQGFRAAAIRDQAVAATDADCRIHRWRLRPGTHFVSQHRRLAEPIGFSGNRVLLSAAFTHKVIEQQIAIQSWNWADWVRARGRGEVNRIMPLVRLSDGAFRKRHPQQWKGVKTCNLSAWRSDLVRVNGLDESYAGWGLEDSDLVIRLLHAGVKHKSARFAAPVFHLWHRENDRSRLPENESRLHDVLHSQRVQAMQGLNRYLRRPD
jgi:hypothetical protein